MLKSCVQQIRTWINREDGQDLLEYGLVVGFIALVVAAVLPAFGVTVSGLYSQIGTFVSTLPTTP